MYGEENKAARVNVNRTEAGRFKSGNPAPRTMKGQRVHDKLTGILQGRELGELSSQSLETMEVAACLDQLSEEWKVVLQRGSSAIDVTNSEIQRLQKKVNNLEPERNKKQKQRKGADTSQLSAREKAARSRLDLAQGRAARFEELSKLFDSHRRTLRDRHATCTCTCTCTCACTCACARACACACACAL